MQNLWEFVDRSGAGAGEQPRESLTYWKDVWRRFRKNKLALVGLCLIVLILLLALVGPVLSSHSYSDQNLALGNIPPILRVTDLGQGSKIYVQESLYQIIRVTDKGEVLGPAALLKNDTIGRRKVFEVDGNEVTLDYSMAREAGSTKKYELYLNGSKVMGGSKTVLNRSNLLGTDKLGRDVLARTLYGGRISLLVGIVSALITMLVGVAYGGVSGYEGGTVDNVMMRIVDLLNSIPLMLIVILLMVVTNRSDVGIVILTISLVYWLPMARQVRGQVMSLKEQEFVLAAKALGAPKSRIIFRHLIPNAMGPIVVSMMMSIPQAIFTESFLSFVGLGVAAPAASWGTLANDALGGIRSYPYLLIVPSVAIALTMFAFNFVGDGLRDALDPRQRQ
ncbi:MAG: ABC transporter permease [Clostridiales bacterium]|uniref:ABC transporter permease n=1 Tax=Provencibacterium massiliense TaxID=1841868 RepID=UPI0009A5FE56|nr:ABC transporter permease [Provencibacterium massiliense]PWM38908.1 MAG: ABC transporter permease [Clostridiales bacterium]RGB65422.1 ABC transporter permease [Harryflintia acetispora]